MAITGRAPCQHCSKNPRVAKPAYRRCPRSAPAGEGEGALRSSCVARPGDVTDGASRRGRGLHTVLSHPSPKWWAYCCQRPPRETPTPRGIPALGDRCLSPPSLPPFPASAYIFTDLLCIMALAFYLKTEVLIKLADSAIHLWVPAACKSCKRTLQIHFLLHNGRFPTERANAVVSRQSGPVSSGVFTSGMRGRKIR